MRVLVVGGSEEYVGAVYLAATAALRSGAESVVVMAPEKVAWALNCLSPDLMTRKLKGTYLTPAHEGAIRKLQKTADVMLIGNGAGMRPGTQSLMRSLMRWPGIKVIDADAIKAIRGVNITNAIITPNGGEWELLEENSDTNELCKNNVIIKKGSPSEIWTWRVHSSIPTNRGLSKAGMGDVLAGLCAGFLAEGLSLFSAAKKAAKVGNTVAKLLTKKKRGYYFLASDLVSEIKKTKRATRGH